MHTQMGSSTPLYLPIFVDLFVWGDRGRSRWNLGDCLVDSRAHGFQMEGGTVGSSAGTGPGLSGVWTWRLLLANDASDTQAVSVCPVGLELRFPNHI